MCIEIAEKNVTTKHKKRNSKHNCIKKHRKKKYERKCLGMKICFCFCVIIVLLNHKKWQKHKKHKEKN